MKPPWLTGLYDRHSRDGAQFLKFGVVGVANTLIDLGVFCILYYEGGYSTVLSHAAGFVCAVINSYVFNSRWTFRGRKGGAVKFFAVALVTMILSSGLIMFLQYQMPAIVAKALVILFTLFFGFFCNRLFVFKASDGKGHTS